MYKRVSYILFLVSLLACEVHKENKEEVKKDTIVTAIPEPDTSVSEPVKKETREEKAAAKLNLSAEEQNLLLFINEIPLGSPYSRVKEVLPELKEVKIDSKHEKQGQAASSLLSYKTELSFHFNDDSLYSYYYNIVEPNDKKADKLFKVLQNFYSLNFGEYTVKSVEEEDHYNRSCEWRKDSLYIILDYNVNSSNIRWGFQSTKPE